MFENFKLEISEDFCVTDLYSWIQLINFMPRFPIQYIVDCFCCCYSVRSNLRISSRILSFIIALFLSTMADNLTNITHDRKLATFEDQNLIIYFIPIWLLFNAFPYDIVFKVARFFRPIIGFFSGALIGLSTTQGVDTGIELFANDFIKVILLGLLFGSVNDLVVMCTAKTMKQAGTNAFITIFECFIAFTMYYWFTDLGHISDKFWFDKEYVRFFVILTIATLEAIRSVVPEKVYLAIYHFFESIVTWFYPYYGSTWVPGSSSL